MGRLVILVKRSHLRSCTLDCGTAVGSPNCGQRVADDNARLPKSICWFLGSIRSTSSEPKGLSNMYVVRPGSVSLRGARLVSSGVCDPRRLTVIDRSYANSPVCCRLTTPRSALPHSKWHLPPVEVSAENTLIGTVSAVLDFWRSG